MCAPWLVIVLAGCTTGGSPVASPSTSWGPDSYDHYEAAYADWAPRYIACARKYGADAKELPDHAIDNAFAEGRPVKDFLDAECVDEVGERPKPPPATAELLQGLYVLYLEEAQCLREQGYDISQPPSQDEWVENYSGESWNPLMDVYLAGFDVQTADGKCPQPDEAEAWRLGYSGS